MKYVVDASEVTMIYGVRHLIVNGAGDYVTAGYSTNLDEAISAGNEIAKNDLSLTVYIDQYVMLPCVGTVAHITAQPTP